ncbi:MAG: ParB N-terminal domain-containing protein [Pseudomonadota bacterium]
MPKIVGKHNWIDVAAIYVGPRLRGLNEKAVQSLTMAIEESGFQGEIGVTSYDGEDTETYLWKLVYGHHRLEACKRLGILLVDVLEYENVPLQIELLEIDENLCRAELTPGERAKHLQRRKEIRDEQEKDNCVTNCDTKPVGRNKEFDTETAEKTGLTRGSINRERTRAEKIVPSILDDMISTGMDKGVELDALKSLSHEEQEQVHEGVKSKQFESYREGYKFIHGADPEQDKEDRRRASLMRSWKKCTSEDRQWFLQEVGAKFIKAAPAEPQNVRNKKRRGQTKEKRLSTPLAPSPKVPKWNKSRTSLSGRATKSDLKTSVGTTVLKPYAYSVGTPPS